MELELLSLPLQTRAQLSTKVKNYKSDLDNLSRQIEKAEKSFNEKKGGDLFEKETVNMKKERKIDYF